MVDVIILLANFSFWPKKTTEFAFDSWSTSVTFCCLMNKYYVITELANVHNDQKRVKEIAWKKSTDRYKRVVWPTKEKHLMKKWPHSTCNPILFTQHTQILLLVFFIGERVCVNVGASFWVYDAFDASVTHMYTAYCIHNQHLPAPNY